MFTIRNADTLNRKTHSRSAANKNCALSLANIPEAMSDDTWIKQHYGQPTIGLSFLTKLHASKLFYGIS